MMRAAGENGNLDGARSMKTPIAVTVAAVMAILLISVWIILT
ncbi:hypothetical protein RMN56_20765 [Micromonospora halotolerans]|uniref:Uncharacterized protein n=1 Tax=Micromonospora halotolerans TaxID=709879 RepID=A0ABY9ZQM7_9ACTN|nr:hypothetical protein [Micromonospora halotolerans]WNM37588.1 hypothetical protein RMN56_20765 [Micromonospora halotolerans]